MIPRRLDRWGGLFETDDAVAVGPLAALLKQLDTLEALEHVAFHDEATGTLERLVLGHGDYS